LRLSSAYELTDGQLMVRFQSLGDETVFAFLIQRHGRITYSVAQRAHCTAHDGQIRHERKV
jgi:hypothetical protein